MKKRLCERSVSETFTMSVEELKDSLLLNEGQTVLVEGSVHLPIGKAGITTAEIAKAMGADIVCLSDFDVFAPKIYGLDPQTPEERKHLIYQLRLLTGRSIGLVMEPLVATNRLLLEERELPLEQYATSYALDLAEKMGFDLLCLRARSKEHPGNEALINSLRRTKKRFHGLVFVSPAYGRTETEPLIIKDTLTALIESGADALFIPPFHTIPPYHKEEWQALVTSLHEQGILCLSTIAARGTTVMPSQKLQIQQMEQSVDGHYLTTENMIFPSKAIYAISCQIRTESENLYRVARSINR